MKTFRYISLGGGVQSSTLVELLVEGELEPVDAVIFADTGNEPDYTYNQVEYLSGRLEKIGMTVETVSAGKPIHNRNGRFASPPLYVEQDGKKSQIRRQCTSEYKILPLEKRVRELLVEAKLARKTKAGIYIGSEYIRNRIRNLVQYRDLTDEQFDGVMGKLRREGKVEEVNVEVLLGITMDEVTRMKPNKGKFFTNVFPLIDKGWTRQDCKDWLRSRDLPVPMKSACIICPYHHDDYWSYIKENRKEDWTCAVEYDRWLRSEEFKTSLIGSVYLHSSCVSLDQVVFSEEKRSDDFCDEGYCFI